MREDRILAKLAGLLYIALLVILGISPARILLATESGEVTTVKPVEALKEVEVSFEAGTFSSGTPNMALVLQPGETAKLDQFYALRSLDATGSLCYDELAAWAAAHPAVDVGFTMPLPVAGDTDFRAESVDLTGIDSEQIPEALRFLSLMPQLRQLELGTPDDGTAITSEDLDALRAALPEAEVRFTVTLLGQPLDPNAESLDLSALSSENVESAAAALSSLPKLKDVVLPGEAEGLSLEDALTIAQAAPEALVHYAGSLYGRAFDLADEGLDLNHVKVEDQGELVRQVLGCMRACTWLDMDSCGVDNEHMAQIRDENPEIEVIWRVWFGTNYSVRTNVTKILASMPSKGGVLAGSACADLQYCTKVRYLDLGHNRDLTDFEFIRSMPDLEVVVISMTAIDDLSPFASCPHLRWLEAGNTHLSDLSPLVACTELRHLNIGTNINITDISPIYDMDLKRLWIGSYTPVPVDQIREMRERHPDCIVNTTVPSGIGGTNEGYVLEGWKSFQNYLTADWNYFAVHHDFPPQRPIGWFKVVYKCFDYNLGTGAYSFAWNDPLYDPHDPGVAPVNVKVLDTSFLLEDWEDPGSIIPDVLSDPPGETLYEFEH